MTMAGIRPASAENMVLGIRNLIVKYRTYDRNVTALSDVNLDIPRSTIIGVVGESGCGKSTLGFSIIGLLQRPPALVESGEIMFREKDMLKLEESELSELRGTGISMIFQEPMTSLDPVYNVGQQLSEAIEVREKRKQGLRANKEGYKTPHLSGDPRTTSYAPPGLAERLAGSGVSAVARGGRKAKRTYMAEALDALKEVQISDPERVLDKYPHELSGGMAQRVMIAEALLQKPALLIADEPTSALDVTTQAQVLFLMKQLRNQIGTSILCITHDLAVAAQIADEIIVMYAGEIVEQASTREMFHDSLHPYSESLLQSFSQGYKDEGKMEAISGDVPNLKNLPSGCRFHPRCKYAFSRCSQDHPALDTVSPNHLVACFLRSPLASVSKASSVTPSPSSIPS